MGNSSGPTEPMGHWYIPVSSGHTHYFDICLHASHFYNKYLGRNPPSGYILKRH